MRTEVQNRGSEQCAGEGGKLQGGKIQGGKVHGGKVPWGKVQGVGTGR